MRNRLFATKSEDDGLMLSDKTIPYANIRSISHFNSRRIANFVPEFEAFCILIGDSTGNTTLLYDRIKLRLEFFALFKNKHAAVG